MFRRPLEHSVVALGSNLPPLQNSIFSNMTSMEFKMYMSNHTTTMYLPNVMCFGDVKNYKKYFFAKIKLGGTCSSKYTYPPSCTLMCLMIKVLKLLTKISGKYKWNSHNKMLMCNQKQLILIQIIYNKDRYRSLKA